jgi:hypothetical protein
LPLLCAPALRVPHISSAAWHRLGPPACFGAPPGLVCAPQLPAPPRCWCCVVCILGAPPTGGTHSVSQASRLGLVWVGASWSTKAQWLPGPRLPRRGRARGGLARAELMGLRDCWRCGSGHAVQEPPSLGGCSAAERNGEKKKGGGGDQPDGRACQQPRSAYRREWRKQQKHHQPATREGMRAAWQRLSLGARCRAGFFQDALSKRARYTFARLTS